MTAAAITDRRVLRLALPIMASNLSTPLLGIVDTAVVGRLPDPAHIGAVAVGALVFSFVFWAFGFLRMGTTGMTAQALGAEDPAEVQATLARAVVTAGVAGAALIALQWPIRELAFHLVDASPQVETLARRYFDARIYSAPAALTNYALLGWFVGRGRTDVGLALQLVLNVTNMALDASFVLGLGWGVGGVGLGTTLAEWTAALVGIAVAARHLRSTEFAAVSFDRKRIFDRAMLRRTFAVNADIMVRSLSLVFVFVFFMAEGASRGDVLLAANAVLMQFIDASAYFLDGLAFAAESLVGRALGAKRPADFWRAFVVSTRWAVGIAALLSLAFLLVGPHFVDLLTTSPEARSAAREYLPWAAAAPIAGVLAFQFDGVFIGATRTVAMRNAMLLSTGIFLLAWWLLLPFGNHGLWAAFFVHYAARTVTLGAPFTRWRTWFPGPG